MARIVIAEDATHILKILSLLMARHGHQVLAAPSGRLALEHLKNQPADLLITDVAMPEGDGIALARGAFELCPTLQWVLILTSCCNQQDILSQLADPRVSLFPKPFSPSQLLQEIERVTSSLRMGPVRPGDPAALPLWQPQVTGGYA